MLNIFLPVIFPLIAGIFILLIRKRGIRLERTISILAVLILTFINLNSFEIALKLPPQAYALGNWVPPFGIILVLDKLSGLMILLTSLLALAALWFAIRQKIDEKGVHFHTFYQIQLFGLNGAFMTGDLFNLFVFFEVLLLASYGLLLHSGGRLNTRSGLHYVVLNLIGSTLFLFAVGALYGVLGTLNLADMSARISTLSNFDEGVVAAAGLMLLAVFGIKSAMFPFYLWLPQAYSNTTAPVAALFAIMTKVGIYAIIRVHGTLFSEQAGDLAYIYIPWVLWLGLATVIMAGFGAIASKGLKELVAYLVLASVATLLIGIGINSKNAISATIYYLIHSTLVAGGLFLLVEWIRQGRGEIGDKFEKTVAMPRAALVGSIFMFAMIAMVGLPPFSGFIGKLLILSSALENERFFLILAIILISSLILVVAAVRSGLLIFYNTIPKEALSLEKITSESFKLRGAASIFGLLTISVILVILANPITNFTDSIANQITDLKKYNKHILNLKAIENPHKELVE